MRKLCAPCIIGLLYALLIGPDAAAQPFENAELYYDLSERRVEHLDLYLSSGGDPSADIRLPKTGQPIDLLELAIRTRNESAAIRLLRAGASPSSSAEMIKLAGQVRMWEIVTLLAEADPAQLYNVPPGEHPLLYAVAEERSDIAESLLSLLEWDEQADVEAILTNAMLAAANSFRDKELIQKLVDAGADVNSEPVVVIAAWHCDAELVDIFLRAGADATQSYRGESALEDALGCYTKTSAETARKIVSQLVAADRRTCQFTGQWQETPPQQGLALLSELCK